MLVSGRANRQTPPFVDQRPRLFGAEDQYPSPEEVDEFEKVLTAAGKEFEFHSYEGAGHAFFATDRPSYRPEAANEGWQRIWEFFDRTLSNG